MSYIKYYVSEKDLQFAIGRIFKALDEDTKLEYTTQYGRIDIDTSKLIVEIKEVTKYKEGIGQLISYGSICPHKRKLLLLFNKDCEFIPKEKLNKISSLCKKTGILVFVVCKNNLYDSFYDFLTKYIYKPRVKKSKPIIKNKCQ